MTYDGCLGLARVGKRLPRRKNIAIFYFPLSATVCWFVRRPHPQGPAVSSASCWRCVWICRLWMSCACSLLRDSEGARARKKNRELGAWTLGCGQACHTVYCDGPSSIRTVRWQLGSAPSPFSKYLAARNPTAYPLPHPPPRERHPCLVGLEKS
jgi:hypothetical protein